ncbi:MAG: hypothetical protein MG2_0227 [uncultured Candidatus Poseidoniales archaeon]|nr:MAG: hypothetical protein MG2_0227 [uncultured Candidatus Poseidoniales archaeon]
MSATLNLTEVLSSLQDYLTKDGSISTEGRSFTLISGTKSTLTQGRLLLQKLKY